MSPGVENQKPYVSPDIMRQKLENVLGDRSKFLKSARASFKQFDTDNSNSLSIKECRALIDRLIVNLSLPPIDDNTLVAIFERFNTSDGDEMNAEDFSIMFWQILWRVKEKYYPSRNVCVRRSFFVGSTAIGHDRIKRLFTFQKKLGSGSFGEVHMVIENSSALERCCKIINKDKVMLPVEQIEAEVTVLKKLDHPNVIKIFEVLEDLHNIYIIQEICEGGEILKRITQAAIRGQVLTEKYVRQIMWQLFSALAYIHDEHICHKDLKPENVLFQTKECSSEIKVIDFGLAEIFQREDQYSTHAAGTVLYMAPEVHNCRVSMKCDLWSAGCIMFQMLTGELPFSGRTAAEVRTKTTRGEPPYDTAARHLTTDAISLLKGLLKKHPGHRLSARQALEHPWFLSTIVPDVQLDADICHNLTLYAKQSGLKTALINLMTHQLNLNSKKVRKLSDLFKQFDVNHSGKISKGELRKALERAGFESWDINKIVQALDIDGSGDITYTEFLAAAYSWRESEVNIVRTAFNKLDHDHDGRISVPEFVELFNGDNQTRLISPDDMRELLEKVDKNGDGVIDWEEFLAYMRPDHDHHHHR